MIITSNTKELEADVNQPNPTASHSHFVLMFIFHSEDINERKQNAWTLDWIRLSTHHFSFLLCSLLLNEDFSLVGYSRDSSPYAGGKELPLHCPISAAFFSCAFTHLLFIVQDVKAIILYKAASSRWNIMTLDHCMGYRQWCWISHSLHEE